MTAHSSSAPIKVLAFMEATVINGAAKSLLNFCDTVATSARPEPAVHVSIATFHRSANPDEKPINTFTQAVASRGIELTIVPERYRFDPQAIKALQRAVDSIQPDVIQTNNVKSHALIKMAGLHRRYRWLAFHHGYTAPDFKMRLYNQLDRWSLPSAQRIVAVCGPFRDQLISMGIPRSRIRVLHNSAAVLPADFRSSVEQHSRVKNLLAIGRLSSEKAHADLIKALDIMRRSKPHLDWKLVVVGSGPEEQNLKTLTRELHFESRITFALQQSDVLPFYASADAMILPSHTEGSPHVVLEAMSAGVPIIATNVGGIPEILADGETAILVPPSDPQALAGSIGRLLESPDQASTLAASAKEVLREKFSHEAHARSLLAIYQDLLASTANSAPAERKLA